MRRISRRGFAGYSSIKPSQWIHGFHWEVWTKSDPGTAVNNGSESVEILDSFWTLRNVFNLTYDDQEINTNQSILRIPHIADAMNKIRTGRIIAALSRFTRVLAGRSQWLNGDIRNMWPGPFHDTDPLISLNEPYLPGSSSGRVQGEDVKQRRWHHLRRFRKHWAQCDWLCHRWHAHSKSHQVSTEVEHMDYRPTTCQPSLKNFGITSSNTAGSIRIKPLVEGWSW